MKIFSLTLFYFQTYMPIDVPTAKNKFQSTENQNYIIKYLIFEHKKTYQNDRLVLKMKCWNLEIQLVL